MKITFEKAFSVILGILLIGIIYCMFLFSGCNPEPRPINSSKDSLNTIIAEKENIAEYWKLEAKAALHKADSSSNLKPLILIRHRTIYDSLYFQDTACQKSLFTLNASHKVLAENDSTTISELRKAITSDSLKDLANNSAKEAYKIKAERDSTRVVELTDTLSTVKRKGFWKGFKLGFGTGAATMKTVDVISDLKR